MQTLPVVAVNGVIGAQVSPLDRGFAYGDGVFETCKMLHGKIPLWHLHKKRLLKSCEKLLIPVAIDLVEAQLASLIASLAITDIANAVVKFTVTRGQGGRGYRAPDSVQPTLVIAVFSAANYPQSYFSEGVSVRLCNQRLSCNPSLAGLKHLNRLEQILARAEWQDDAIAEGILLDIHGNVIEAVFSNIFLIKNGELFTPDLSEAGVAGVMRRFIIETLAPQVGLKVHVKRLTITDLLSADSIFLCNSLYGIWPVQKILGEQTHVFNAHELTEKLQNLLNAVLVVQQA
ncbi:MAG TPA: aminodeoxychorismate lyase [Cellvibrio sp.]|nr:aminodeoxychorismate lyase [Cellvibrio sp.]